MEEGWGRGGREGGGGHEGVEEGEGEGGQGGERERERRSGEGEGACSVITQNNGRGRGRRITVPWLFSVFHLWRDRMDDL